MHGTIVPGRVHYDLCITRRSIARLVCTRQRLKISQVCTTFANDPKGECCSDKCQVAQAVDKKLCRKKKHELCDFEE